MCVKPQNQKPTPENQVLLVEWLGILHGLNIPKNFLMRSSEHIM